MQGSAESYSKYSSNVPAADSCSVRTIFIAIMIADENSRIELRKSWAGICKLKQHNSFCPLIPGAGFINAGSLMPEDFWNLPFLLAYSVLDDVLTILCKEGIYECNSWMLGAKMEASKLKMPWQDYQLVSAGKDARNDLAHRAVLLSKNDCFLYIDAVERELVAWKVL